MNKFTYSNPAKVYFGNGSADDALNAELQKYGKTVMLAYGGGSIKHNGIYDEVMTLLKKADKTVIEFSGIMSNPTYEKVQEGAVLAKTHGVDFILAVGGGSVIDCCKVFPHKPLLMRIFLSLNIQRADFRRQEYRWEQSSQLREQARK